MAPGPQYRRPVGSRSVEDEGSWSGAWRAWWRPLLAALLAVALAGLAQLVVLRTLGWHPGPAVAAVSLLPVLLAAALPVLVVALALRHRALAVAAAALCLVWGVLYVPELGDGPRPTPPGWSTVRVVSANVLWSNPRLEAAVDEILAADPDVVVLQEVTDDHEAALDELGLAEAYPYRMDTPRRWGAGSLVLSRLPLEDARVLEVGGREMPAATLVTANGPVDLVAVHATPPLIRQPEWRRELSDLEALVRSSPRPLLVGDFNATADHKAFRDLLAAGVEDGQRVAGTGWGATWPSDDGLVPEPLLRIDHVLAGDGLQVTSLRLGDGPGSDHRPLIAEVAVAPTA